MPTEYRQPAVRANPGAADGGGATDPPSPASRGRGCRSGWWEEDRSRQTSATGKPLQARSLYSQAANSTARLSASPRVFVRLGLPPARSLHGGLADVQDPRSASASALTSTSPGRGVLVDQPLNHRQHRAPRLRIIHPRIIRHRVVRPCILRHASPAGFTGRWTRRAPAAPVTGGTPRPRVHPPGISGCGRTFKPELANSAAGLNAPGGPNPGPPCVLS